MRLNMRRKPPVRLDRTHTVTAKSGPHTAHVREQHTNPSFGPSLFVSLDVAPLSRRRPYPRLSRLLSVACTARSPSLRVSLTRITLRLSRAGVPLSRIASPLATSPPPFPKSFRTHRRPRPAPSPAKSHHMPPCSRWGRRRAHHHAIVKRGSARLVVPTVRLMKRQVSAVMSRWSRSRSGPTASAASTS